MNNKTNWEDFNSWPVKEAKRLIKRLDKQQKDHAVFETGYGPSGLPHIGTFGEIVRTSFIRKAFTNLCPLRNKILTFSDDMDGFRKVPTNLPQQAMLQSKLHLPLSSVPDPFGVYSSLAEYNNNQLLAFLKHYRFDCQFVSATNCYQSGAFDEVIIKVLQVYDKIMGIIMPTLKAERQQSYSPILPLCPDTGRVLQVPVVNVDPEAGTIVYKHNGKLHKTLVTGGKCKLQWKIDWAARWVKFGVDYEMYGKDLVDAANLSQKICQLLGGTPPLHLVYELFLDENGNKISKSKGNGITIDKWLQYAPQETLALYMYQSPTKAKKLAYQSIIKATEDYINHLDNPDEPNNPLVYLHDQEAPELKLPISFSTIINLANICQASDTKTLWKIVQNYYPHLNPESNQFLDQLINNAVNYCQDIILPTRNKRQPSAKEALALKDLLNFLRGEKANSLEPEAIQTEIYSIGKAHDFKLAEWFKSLYQIILGQDQGPRLGTLITLYGITNTVDFLSKILEVSHDNK